MVSGSVKISELWAVHVHPALAPPLSSHDPDNLGTSAIEIMQ